MEPGVEVAFLRRDQRALGDAGFDDELDPGLLNIGQHLQDDLAAALDHAENWWLFLFERSASGGALNLLSRPLRLFFEGDGIALVTGDDINLVDPSPWTGR